MSLSEGDVVLISFPFSDLSSEKVRPTLVLSRKNYNNKNSDIIVCLITSNILRKGDCLIKIDRDHRDFVSAGFKVPSSVIVDKIHSLHKSLIKRRLGQISGATFSSIQTILKSLFLREDLT